MRKIHVITQKEVVRANDLVGCVAVVIDVFLATSTISFLLNKQYEEVYATQSIEDAERLYEQLGNSPLLLGELNGNLVEGFNYPDPSLLESATQVTTAIISSTNGTVAIEKSTNAKRLYISSLTNGHVIAEELQGLKGDDSIVIVCSGNAGSFSLEDMVGAGQLIHKIMQYKNYNLSDSAIVALEMFKKSRATKYKNLLDSRTAQLLSYKGYEGSLHYVLNNIEKIPVLPVYGEGKIVNVLKGKQSMLDN